MSDNGGIFNPESQDLFWGRFSPDIRSFLDCYEKEEDWTYSYDELPESFMLLSQALPNFSPRVLDTDEGITEVIEKMIVVLSSMPFRQSISALSWLDRDIRSDTEVSWSVAIFMHATTIFMFEQDHQDFRECKNIHDRCNIVLHSRLATKIFSHLNKQRISDIEP